MTAVSGRRSLRIFWARAHRWLFQSPLRTRARMEEDDDCIFCCIASGSDPTTEILWKDEECVCFRDISPVAPYHYLVVPHIHITNCKVLKAEHTALVVKMANAGLAALQANGFSDFNNVSLGFHIPPRTSVHHLHLHVLAPQTKLYEDAEYRCLTNNSPFFLPVEVLLRNPKMNPKNVLWSPGTAAVTRQPQPTVTTSQTQPTSHNS
ncbi:adenosine 5'-monophosphoramidase HINT3-like [Engraulis encrasicolus]|uniref:adenosine 5'-monophosphoramidase HINT3-like n=1 Tax=Engraulis encrasicolus TaxID=184585 RepID=UPI002FD37B4F